MEYMDRHKRPLRPGQTLRVRECVGRYGQCATYEGVLKELSRYGGGTLELTKPATVYLRNSLEHKTVGDLIYVTMPPSGYAKHVDFEHGHEAWVEIITEQ